MNRLVGIIIGNPAVLLWLVLGAFGLGAVSAGGIVWKVQGWRLDAVQAKFDGFVATVKAEGEAAEKLAKAEAAEDKRKKEIADHDYQSRIDSLVADNQRLRNERSRRGYVPAAPAGSRNPEIACFDRADLEQALRRLDEGISGLIDEGDADAVGLNVARRWAASIRPDKSPDSRANPQP